jgi:tetratricopeptide (TPR) repeat protein
MKSTKASPKRSKPNKSTRRPGPGATTGEDKKYLAIAVGAVAIVTLLVFINCIANGWAYDDYLHVVNPRLQSLSNIFTFLAHYRPMAEISYAMDFWLWGWLGDKVVGGFHFTNVVVHTANSVLVLLICYRILRNLPAAVLACLIFALHPVQTDSVAYVSGRPGLLCSLFYLAAFYLYLSYRQRPSWKMLCLVLICWLFSLMSGQVAASFPIAVFLWNYSGEFERVEGAWPRKAAASGRAVLRSEGLVYLGMVVVALAYSYYGHHVLDGGGRGGGSGFFSNLPTQLRVQASFLKQLVWPTPMAQYSGGLPTSTSVFDWKVLLSGILVLGTLGAGILALGKWRLVSFAILFYFAALLTVSHVIPNDDLIADHCLYLPILGFALLAAVVAIALAKGSEKRMVAVYATGASALLIFAILSVRQNAVWADDRTFWEANYARVPNSPRATYGLAAQSITTNPRKAQELFRQCLRLDPTYGRAYTALASLANNKEDIQDVESLLQTALEIPDDRIEASGSQTAGQFKSQVKTALAIVKQAQGDQASAESALWEAVSLDPANPQPYEILGGIYAKDKSKQTDVLTRELSAIPDSIPAREALVVLLVKDQKLDEAIPYLNAILSINPNDVFANYQMGQIYRTRKDCARARAHLKTAASFAIRSSDVSDVKDAIKQLAKECGGG